ncbi:MAG: hypothetical protein JWQ88_3691, partial [Rhodoferax sp.]|nr:hypothetical protein [Rhodoferax sp.]
TAGSVASLVSTAALLVAGRRECGAPFAPLNAISHWVWGDEALGRNRPDLRHSGVAWLTHQASSVFWAGLHARLRRQMGGVASGAGLLGSSVAMSAFACLADYRFTPPRLRPGFEHRLSRTAIAGVYAAFALGLALGVRTAEGRRQARRQKLREVLPGRSRPRG